MNLQFIDYYPLLEAEDSLLQGTASILTNSDGFSGNGFVGNYSQPGASTTFTVDIPLAGDYFTTLQYSNGNSSDRTLSIYVNGVDVRQTELSPTENWNSWNAKTETLNLQQGINTIEYRYDSDDTGFVNLDYAWLTKDSNNGAIGKPIVDSGLVFEVEKYAQIPSVSADNVPRMIGMTTQGDNLFVIEEQDGRIYQIVDTGSGTPTTELFFDVKEAIPLNTGGRGLDLTDLFHGGLKGLAFHPEFEINGKFYTSLMEERPSNSSTFNYLSDSSNPIAADSVLVEWTYNFQDNAVDINSYRELFRVGMPVYDHPIKEISFNPFARPGDEDYGLLYIAHGDGSVKSAIVGGGLNSDALGKILRIDPLQNGSNSYTIPTNNPFVGNPNMLNEVYSIGHRNPHTFSFAQDNQGNSHLIVAEPGRDNIEEINLAVPGGNYGWSEREGTFVHLPNQQDIIQGLAPLPEDDAENGYIYPAAQWGPTGEPGTNSVAQAVAGGYVIDNGSDLQGQYIFGDFAISGRIFHSSFNDLLDAVTQLDPNNPSRDEPSELTQAEIGEVTILFDHDNNAATPSVIRSSFKDVLDDETTYNNSGRADIRFGQGSKGELYVLNKTNGYIYLVTSSLGKDVIRGTSDNDTFDGSSAGSIINGLQRNDALSGQGSNDTIEDNGVRDILTGDSGRNILYGGNVRDPLRDGKGNNTLDGNTDADILFGNEEKDIFTIKSSTSANRDTIQDYLDGFDNIGLSDDLNYDDLDIFGSGFDTFFPVGNKISS